MNTMKYWHQNRKCVSFFEKWIFGSYRDYCVLSHLLGSPQRRGL